MRVATQDLRPGMVTGRQVVTAEGVVLLESGTVLTAWQITNLYNWRIDAVDIADSPPGAPSAPPGRSSASFLEGYVKTVDAVRHTFENIRLFHEVPVLDMEELANQRIALLADTVGVLDYLYQIRLHSDHTFEHSLHVAITAAVIGRWRGFKGKQLGNLVLAGLLHDIGKLFVPPEILDKPGALTPGEYEHICRHPAEGHRLAASSPRIDESAKLGILQHHERRDGSGYPGKLAGNAIHEYARIIAVADIYSAMTADRPYRRRLTPLAAVDAIAEQMRDKLDPDICVTFLDNMRECFTGSDVLLSDGQRAKIVVLGGRDRYWTKPVVRTAAGQMIDLLEEGLSIVELIQEK